MKRAFAIAAIVSVLSISTAFAGDSFNPATLNNATVQQALQMLNAMSASPVTNYQSSNHASQNHHLHYGGNHQHSSLFLAFQQHQH